MLCDNLQSCSSFVLPHHFLSLRFILPSEYMRSPNICRKALKSLLVPQTAFRVDLFSVTRLVNCQKGFTFLEMLIAVSIVAILAAILVPISAKIHRQAEIAESLSKMRQIGEAVQMFSAEHDMRLPGAGYSSPLIRWMHVVAPYMGVEANEMYRGVSYSSQGYSTELDRLFTCPALHNKRMLGRSTSYVGRYGLNMELTPGEGMTGVSTLSIPNPAGTVLMATKAGNEPGLRPLSYPNHPWGVAANYRPDRNPEAGPDVNGKIGLHGYLFCDGHVETSETLLPASAFKIND